MQLLINEDIVVDGRTAVRNYLHIVPTETGNVKKILAEGNLTIDRYLPDIYKIVSDKFLVKEIEVTSEMYDSEHDLYTYEFNASEIYFK